MLKMGFESGTVGSKAEMLSTWPRNSTNEGNNI